MADRIIVATDGSEHGRRAIAFAAEMSARLGQGLSIVHVDLHLRPSAEMARLAEAEHLIDHLSTVEGIEALSAGASVRQIYDSARDELQRARLTQAIGQHILDRARDAAEEAGALSVRVLHAQGDYADEILDSAEEEDAGIIVLGRRGLGRLREFVLGSVTQKVLHATDRTVVVVR